MSHTEDEETKRVHELVVDIQSVDGAPIIIPTPPRDGKVALYYARKIQIESDDNSMLMDCYVDLFDVAFLLQSISKNLDLDCKVIKAMQPIPLLGPTPMRDRIIHNLSLSMKYIEQSIATIKEVEFSIPGEEEADTSTARNSAEEG